MEITRYFFQSLIFYKMRQLFFLYFPVTFHQGFYNILTLVIKSLVSLAIGCVCLMWKVSRLLYCLYKTGFVIVTNYLKHVYHRLYSVQLLPHSRAGVWICDKIYPHPTIIGGGVSPPDGGISRPGGGIDRSIPKSTLLPAGGGTFSTNFFYGGVTFFNRGAHF